MDACTKPQNAYIHTNTYTHTFSANYYVWFTTQSIGGERWTGYSIKSEKFSRGNSRPKVNSKFLYSVWHFLMSNVMLFTVVIAFVFFFFRFFEFWSVLNECNWRNSKIQPWIRMKPLGFYCFFMHWGVISDHKKEKHISNNNWSLKIKIKLPKIGRAAQLNSVGNNHFLFLITYAQITCLKKI